MGQNRIPLKWIVWHWKWQGSPKFSPMSIHIHGHVQNCCYVMNTNKRLTLRSNLSGIMVGRDIISFWRFGSGWFEFLRFCRLRFGEFDVLVGPEVKTHNFSGRLAGATSAESAGGVLTWDPHLMCWFPNKCVFRRLPKKVERQNWSAPVKKQQTVGNDVTTYLSIGVLLLTGPKSFGTR